VPTLPYCIKEKRGSKEKVKKIMRTARDTRLKSQLPYLAARRLLSEQEAATAKFLKKLAFLLHSSTILCLSLIFLIQWPLSNIV
jgi:hypothetical protein